MSTAKPAIAVLGTGSWGTALASLIARNGHPTVIWGRDAAQVASINGQHENTRYLPGIPLPETLVATGDLGQAVAGADLVLVVTPSHAFTETLRALAPHRRAQMVERRRSHRRKRSSVQSQIRNRNQQR